MLEYFKMYSACIFFLSLFLLYEKVSFSDPIDKVCSLPFPVEDYVRRMDGQVGMFSLIGSFCHINTKDCLPSTQAGNVMCQ